MLIDAFGWSWEYIDEEMTLPRMDAIVKHWEVIPPLAVSVASIASALGVKRQGKVEKKAEGSIDELMSVLGGAGFKQEKPEWLRTMR